MHYVKRFGEEIHSKYLQNMHLGDGLQRIRYRSEPGAKGLIALLHVVALCSIVGLVATSILVCEKLVWYEKVRKARIRKKIELRRNAFIMIKAVGLSPLVKEFLTSD